MGAKGRGEYKRRGGQQRFGGQRIKFCEADMEEFLEEFVQKLEISSQASEENLTELLVAKVDDVQVVDCNQLANTTFEEHTAPSKKSTHVPIPLQNIKATA